MCMHAGAVCLTPGGPGGWGRRDGRIGKGEGQILAKARATKALSQIREPSPDLT
jgi:hypothetical protein